MQRVRTIPVERGAARAGSCSAHERRGARGDRRPAHGNPADPLTEEEILGKFHECAAQSAPEEQRDRVIDLCGRLEALGNVRELADAIAAVS